MGNILMNLVGLKAIVLHDDPTAYDRWKWLTKNLQKGDLRTLDAGCGNGAFTLYAAKAGNRALGLSFDQTSNEHAQRYAGALKLSNAQFITADLRFVDQQDGALGLFDQIICLETVEHILDDAKLIHDLSALLKPGGKLYLTTPYKHYRHLYGDTLSSHEDGGHVRWGYTHEEMETLFKASGLKIEKQEYVGGMISQKLTNLMRRLVSINHRLAWTVTFPLRLLMLFDPLVTRLFGYPKLSIAVIGVKR